MKNTIKTIVLINLSIYLVSCGPAFKLNKMQDQSIDPELSQYLNQFQIEALSRGVNLVLDHLTMSFDESMPRAAVGSVIAYCQITFSGPNIRVKKSLFKNYDLSGREQIIFHELGHCLLRLDHNDRTERAADSEGPDYGYNMPSSIMNTFHFDSNTYNGNRNEYINRLFETVSVMPLFYKSPSQFDFYK